MCTASSPLSPTGAQGAGVTGFGLGQAVPRAGRRQRARSAPPLQSSQPHLERNRRTGSLVGPEMMYVCPQPAQAHVLGAKEDEQGPGVVPGWGWPWRKGPWRWAGSSGGTGRAERPEPRRCRNGRGSPGEAAPGTFLRNGGSCIPGGGRAMTEPEPHQTATRGVGLEDPAHTSVCLSVCFSPSLSSSPTFFFF